MCLKVFAMVTERHVASVKNQTGQTHMIAGILHSAIDARASRQKPDVVCWN